MCVYVYIVVRVQKMKPNLPKLILPANQPELQTTISTTRHPNLLADPRKLTPSPSPSPIPQITDYDVDFDPDNVVIRGGDVDSGDGDSDDDEIMVVPGSRSITPNQEPKMGL